MTQELSGPRPSAKAVGEYFAAHCVFCRACGNVAVGWGYDARAPRAIRVTCLECDDTWLIALPVAKPKRRGPIV